MRILFLISAIFAAALIHAQQSSALMQTFTGMPATSAAADSVKKGFRGLSVMNEKIIWISGQRGLVGRSTNGGKSFVWRRVQGYEKMDFRTLHAFDKNNAVIATAGTPASILRTRDGGKKWKRVYNSTDSAMFFDGVGFWNKKRGLIFGDPVNGRMFLMETLDGGKTWKEIPFADRPQLVEGEAAFAASGTTIRTLAEGHVYIATGGVKSRLWHSRDYGHHWEVFETPIIQGKPSQGIFSIAFADTIHGVIVGGDYTLPAQDSLNCFYTIDGGKNWIAPMPAPKGYRSSVEYLGQGMFVTSGISGSEYGVDGARMWIPLSVSWGGWNVTKAIPGVLKFVVAGGTSEVYKIGEYTH
jgi:photosystem II stability/assembly factor-like uncharacterized protein